MGLFKGLVNLATATVALPIAGIADAVTLGGSLTDKDETYTGRVAEKLSRAVDEMGEDEWED